MTVGTKSVLFGAHCFFIHPWFVAAAWLRLYGLRQVLDPYVGWVSIWDWRLWLAFFIHDLGYWGKPNMDGEEGEQHPYWAYHFMSRHMYRRQYRRTGDEMYWGWGQGWARFCLYHSRSLCRLRKRQFSLLCPADKLGVAIEPSWLYLPRVIATGEIREYMKLRNDPDSKYGRESKGQGQITSRREWHKRMRLSCRKWAFENRFGVTYKETSGYNYEI